MKIKPFPRFSKILTSLSKTYTPKPPEGYMT